MKKLAGHKRNNFPALQCIRVVDGIAAVTDLEVEVYEPTMAADGLYDSVELMALGIKSDSGLDEYPTLFRFDSSMGDIEGIGTVDADSLLWVFQSASKDETRYNICGVYLETGYLVATDGHRLHRANASIQLRSPVIVPRAAFQWLDKKGQVKIERCANRVRLTQGKRVIVALIVDGQFPDYVQILPKGDKSQAETLSASDLKTIKAALPACKQVGAFSGVAGVSLRFNTGIHCGEDKKRIDILRAPVFGHEFALSSKYLLEAANGKPITRQTWGGDAMYDAKYWLTAWGEALIMPVRFE